MKNIAVVIGRFQPLHQEHLKLIRAAAKFDDYLICLGSSYRAATPKNPFSAVQRQHMISDAIREEGLKIPVFLPIEDFPYDDNAWADQIRSGVQELFPKDKITLVGCNKDDSSYYLKMFPEWDLQLVELESQVSATDIRDLMYLYGSYAEIEPTFLALPQAIQNYLSHWITTGSFERLRREYIYVMGQKEQKTARAGISICTDIVVIHRNRVLLIERRGIVGHKLLALPGGHFENKDKSIKACAIRELNEETGLEILDRAREVEIGSLLKTKRVFDDPNRGSIGRSISHSFLLSIPDEYEVLTLPGSDASDTLWVDLNDIWSYHDVIFSDHLYIISEAIHGENIL